MQIAELRAGLLVVGERVNEPRLRGDLEHEIGQVCRRQQRVDTLAQTAERRGLAERVELLDAQRASGQLVDRMLRREPVARAPVGVIQLGAEALQERPGLRWQRE